MKKSFQTISLNRGWEFTLLTAPDHISPGRRCDGFPLQAMRAIVPDSTDIDEILSTRHKSEWFQAEVPGVIQYDLIREGILTNPFSSVQAAQDAWWVSESDWLYRLGFSLSPGDGLSTGFSRAQITFFGIDTFSDIWFNRIYVGSTENAYRTYTFELPRNLIKSDDNEIIVRVKAHDRMIRDKIPEASRMDLSGPSTGLLGKSLIRRYQRSFFTNSSLLNLGTGVLGIGLNNDVALDLFTEAKISDFSVRTLELSEQKAVISICTEIDGIDDPEEGMITAAIAVFDPDGTLLTNYESRTYLRKHMMTNVNISIPDPKVWWPSGFGKQNLYSVEVELRKSGNVISKKKILYGLKRIELVTERDNGKPCFFLKVNGRNIHCRGYNLIPVDYLKVHGSREEYQKLFTIIRESGANMLRFWGGGAVENDYVYEFCDRLGILVWQDFFLHSNVYPDYDAEFIQNFSLEAEELVSKVRNHASLALLCGGNEQYEGWEEWGWKESMDRFYGESLVTAVLPEIVRKHCHDIPYIVNSPHGLPRAQSPVTGDMHNWGNFYNSTKDPQFVTETCWSIESYSRPETLKEVMGLDVDTYDTPGWYRHWNEITGLPKITRFPYSSYFDVTSLRGYLRSLNIEQAYADYHALSNFRLHSPSNKGILYWSLNKGGPLFQFGCVDYLGYPLMSYYVIKRLFAGIVVQPYRDLEDIRIVGSNETPHDVLGTLLVRHFQIDGTIVNQWEKQLILKSGGISTMLNLENCYREVSDRHSEVIHAEFISGNTVLSEDALLFAPFAEVVAPTKRPLTVRVKRRNETSWEIILSATSVVKMVEMECDRKVLFTENYCILVPGREKVIRVEALDAIPPSRLSVHAVDSTFSQTILL